MELLLLLGMTATGRRREKGCLGAPSFLMSKSATMHQASIDPRLEKFMLGCRLRWFGSQPAQIIYDAFRGVPQSHSVDARGQRKG
jgi:hypothetical protein